MIMGAKATDTPKSTGDSMSKTIDLNNLPTHTHSLAQHSHTIPEHTHTLNEQAAMTSGGGGGHTHTANNAGIHHHAGNFIKFKLAAGTNFARIESVIGPTRGEPYQIAADDGEHTHTINSVANHTHSIPEHNHTVNSVVEHTHAIPKHNHTVNKQVAFTTTTNRATDTGGTGTSNTPLDVTNSYLKLFIWERTE